MKINEKSLAVISVASTCALLFFWVLPHNIALRQLLLFIGCVSGAGLIYQHKFIFVKFKLTFIALYLIFLLFVWVLFHYIFFSLNPSLELIEIQGLWTRAFAGVIAAIGLSIALAQYSGLRKYFYLSLFFVPVINLFAYAYASYLYGGLLEPNQFVFFLFAKIETAYFGALASACAVANIIYLVILHKNPQSIWRVCINLLGIVMVLASAIVSGTKNGIAVALGECFLLFIVMILYSFKTKLRLSVFMLAIAIVVFLAASVAWQGHKSSGVKGWDTLIQDAKVGLDIDNNKQWQKYEGSVPFPINSLGVSAVSNTYTRFAYAAVGARLIGEYPLGYGSVNQSFNEVQTIAGIPHEHRGQVHSGWIDFGLAFGVPGVLLLLTSMISIIYFGVRRHGELDLVAAIFSLTLLGFCLIAEMGYKQYFESWIFMISFSAATIALSAAPSNERMK